jgi:hypothetical protein
MLMIRHPQRRRIPRIRKWSGALLLASAGSLCFSCGGPGGSAGAEVAAGGQASGGATAAGGAPAIDACLLLTSADVETVTGDVAGSLSSTLEDAVGRDPSQCAYPLASDGPQRVVSLAVRRLATAALAAEQQEGAQSGMASIAGAAAVESVPRLGDTAFWVGGQLDQLHVRRGATILIFTVQAGKDPQGAARMLAGRALARLAAPQPGAGRS